MNKSILMTVKDVMAELQVGRPTATRYINMYLGKKRVKGTKLLVPREDFYRWINNGMK